MGITVFYCRCTTRTTVDSQRWCTMFLHYSWLPLTVMFAIAVALLLCSTRRERGLAVATPLAWSEGSWWPRSKDEENRRAISRPGGDLLGVGRMARASRLPAPLRLWREVSRDIQDQLRS